MRRHVLAMIGAAALAAPMMLSGAAQAATPRAVPDAPSIDNVSKGPQIGTVTLDWNPSNSPGVDNYKVQYHSIGPVSAWVQWGETGDAGTQAIIDDLAGGKTYVFQVAAHNGDGWGPWSTDSPPIAPLGIAPPSDLTAAPGDGTVNLSWTAATPPPTGYDIQYKVAGALDVPWMPATPLGTSSTSYRVTDLDPAKQYLFRVRSSSGGDNVSIWIETTTPVSPGTAPLPPASIVAVPGDGQVALSWAAPYPAPAGYQVQYQVNGSGSWLPATPISTTSPSTTVTGLANGTAYFFQVRSVRGSAASTWTATTTPVTPNGTWVVPAAPTSVTGSPGNGLAFIYWTVPANNPATGYDVRYSTNGAAWSNPISTHSTALNYTLTGLTNSATYFIQVRTVNGPQTSAWTQMPSFVVPYAAPNPPTGVSGVPGNGQVTVSWIPPVTTGVSVSGYRVQYSTNGGGTWTTAADLNVPTTTVVVSGLTNGTGYIFRVQAKSPSGDSTWSAASPTIVPPGGPSAPTNVAAVAGDSSATVTWTASPGTPNFPILGYRVTASPGGQTCATNATPPSPAPTTCTVTGLTNGQAYTFTAVAISNAGVSPASAASAPVTPFTTEVLLRITDSSRNGKKVIIKGTAQGVDPGEALSVLARYSGKGKFQPVGEVTVKANGTFRWTTTSPSKTWLRVSDGDAISNTVIVAAK